MPRVFIVNKAGHDFSTAKEFGELIPVTTGNINIFRPDRDLYKIQEALYDFDIFEDFLLLSGNVFANAMAIAVVACKWNGYYNGQLKFLVYDAKHSRYLKHVFVATYDNNISEVLFKRESEPPLGEDF